MSTLTFTRLTAEETQDGADELLDIYTRAYDVPRYHGDAFFSTEAFASRLKLAYDTPGFEVVIGRDSSGTALGWVHGATLPVTRPWWVDLEGKRPTDVEKAAEAADVFWLREIMVLPEHQNQGVGRQLHDATIAGRPEQWTTLTCIVDNEPAHTAYLNWGYEIIGQIKHAPESPWYDAMVLSPGR